MMYIIYDTYILKYFSEMAQLQVFPLQIFLHILQLRAADLFVSKAHAALF